MLGLLDDSSAFCKELSRICQADSTSGGRWCSCEGTISGANDFIGNLEFNGKFVVELLPKGTLVVRKREGLVVHSRDEFVREERGEGELEVILRLSIVQRGEVLGYPV